MEPDTSLEAQQRITLAVEHARLSLRVPRSDERLYREAGEELVKSQLRSRHVGTRVIDPDGDEGKEE